MSDSILHLITKKFLTAFVACACTILVIYVMVHPLIFAMVLYFFPNTIFVILPYYIWMYLDRKTPSTGGRKLRHKYIQNNILANYVHDYFPVKLIKTGNLPAGSNYLLSMFPHGTIPIGSFVNFFFNSNKLDKIFPGIDMRFVTNDLLMFVPLFREIAMIAGANACNKSSVTHLLTRKPSKGIVLCPGGAAEICFSRPGHEYKILKSKRKGFIHLALTTGTPLVPIFTFGEINLYDTYKIFPRFWHSYFHGFDMFVLNGRGFFQQKFGLFPRKYPINTIVGEPIQIPKVSHPSQELINEYHEKFFEALKNLFEKYKAQYDNVGGKAELIFL